MKISLAILFLACFTFLLLAGQGSVKPKLIASSSTVQGPYLKWLLSTNYPGRLLFTVWQQTNLEAKFYAVGTTTNLQYPVTLSVPPHDFFKVSETWITN